MTVSVPSVSLSGRVILVTGALGAIGSAVAQEAARLGASIIATDLPSAGDSRAVELVSNPTISYVPGDVTSEDDMAAVIEWAIQHHGRLDGAANSAGIGGPAVLTAEYPLDTFRRILEVNLIGTFLSVKHEIPALQRSGGGSIVNVGSLAGHSGEMFRSAYGASKAAVHGLTQSAAVEAAGHNIRVNTVSPGPVATDMFHLNVGAPGSPEYKVVVDGIPAGRMAEVIDVAATIIWLLSEGSAFIYGQEILVNGGITAEGISAPRLAHS
ncbi:MAG: linC1 [Methylobacterium brachiatum]|nr:linC1 [Methylobacterium brachiatum]